MPFDPPLPSMLALLTALVFSAPVLAKPGGNAAAAAACRHGGFVDYTDSAGNPFRNTGACVRHAAHGGALVPVAAGPFSVVYSGSVAGVFSATLNGTGLEATAR